MVVHVTVSSPDGTVKHPFKSDTSVGEIKHYAFEKINPAGIREQDVYLTFAGTRVSDESLPVSHFASGERKETAAFTLAWHNQAG